MATSIYAGGARRGAAPSYSPRAVLTSQAGLSEDELMNQLLASFQQAATAAPVAAAEAAAPSFNMPSIDFGTAGDNPSQISPLADLAESSGVTAGQVQGAGQLMGVIGNLAQDSDLAKAGSVLSLGGMLAGSKSAEDLALNTLTAGMSLAGIPGAGLVGSVGRGSVPGMVNSGLALAAPQLAAVNALSGLLGIGTLGSAVNNAIAAPAGSFGEMGVMGALSLGEAVNMNEAYQNSQQPGIDAQTAALLGYLAQAQAATSDSAMSDAADAAAADAGGYDSAVAAAEASDFGGSYDSGGYGDSSDSGDSGGWGW